MEGQEALVFPLPGAGSPHLPASSPVHALAAPLSLSLTSSAPFKAGPQHLPISQARTLILQQ